MIACPAPTVTPSVKPTPHTLQRKIARTPARTLAGLAAKVKVFALTMAEDADDAETMRMVASSFMRDVVALEKIA
jgi:hypothetical protein